MAPEIVRKWIGGVWRTVEAEQSAGGALPPGGTTGQVLTKASNADGDADWEAGGGSQPGAVVVRKSAVLAYSDLGYSSGSGFAIFDSGIALATGEEVIALYAHKPTEFKSATGIGTDFTFSAYTENTASNQLGTSNEITDGAPDSVTTESSSIAAIDNPVVPYPVVVGATIDADCNLWVYLAGKNEALTQGQVQIVAVVGTAP